MKKVIMVILAIMLVAGGLFAVETNFNRNETIYVGGGLWNTPTNWNPFTTWAAVPGTVGLVYETLFSYNPIKDDLVPYLAESGKWTSKDTYEVKLRKGVKWHDGKDFSAADVEFTFDVAKKYNGLYYNTIWEFLKSVDVVDDYTVKFSFKDPRYHQWKFQLYQLPIVPKHIFDGKTQDELISSANPNAVGTGSYTWEAATEDKMIWLRNDNWWGIKVFKKTPAPKRVVVLKAFSNNVALGMIMKGELDVSNFFLSGSPTVKKAYDLATYYKNAPYMLSDNTALIYLNTKKEPMNDVNFRRAMAFGINTKVITEKVFENMVQPADPTGLLPIPAWQKYIDKNVVAKYGYKYDPAAAKKMLAAAGYKDVNKDGFVETKAGKPFKLEIICPFGWTDWMESIKIIAENLRGVGINVEAKFPDYNKYLNDQQYGKFDIILANDNTNVSSTPWTYWNRVYSFDINHEQVVNGNYSRYDNKTLFDLIRSFDRTNPENAKEAMSIASKIQEITLKDMPAIPLWYNGAWFLASKSVWTNYPDETNKYGFPLTWGGRFQLGGLDMLLNLKPAGK